MEYHDNGNRFTNYYKWESEKNKPYDFAKHGLLQHILSGRIANSENPTLRIILHYYEQCIVFISRYTDILKHFKDYHWKNR